LKYQRVAEIAKGFGVAVFMTAWIEIKNRVLRVLDNIVAVFMTAWIEMMIQDAIDETKRVAVFMTAWIEIKGISGAINGDALQSS